jgi:hypothetical protein
VDVTAEHLFQAGYVRALWVPSPERWWMRPDSQSVCPEHQALAELAEDLETDDE